MKTFRDPASFSTTMREQSKESRIGVVPTMGALHAGHLRLVDRARAECDVVIGTLFVNPLQFAPGEDFERYPRDEARDLRLFEEHGVDVVFAPPAETMYGSGFQTSIEPGALASSLCGKSRPGHFAGVTTVVGKLFHLSHAHDAYFGQKDFQQVRVLEQMVRDLDFDVRLRIVATERESDGLALSSRNRYLSPEQRAVAPALIASLRAVEASFDQGERRPESLIELGRRPLLAAAGLELEYFEVLDDETLTQPEALDERGVVAVAARLGTTRLIDNELLGAARARLLPPMQQAAPR